MRFRVKIDGVIEATDYSDALRRVGEHFAAWASDTPSDDPDSWLASNSVHAPQFETGAEVHVVPTDAERHQEGNAP